MAVTRELIDSVWERGRVMPEADPQVWRQDACGAWMKREHFEREDSDFGWKMESLSSGDSGSLRPFNVRNHYDIGAGRAQCHATADRSKVPAEKYASPPRNRSL